MPAPAGGPPARPSPFLELERARGATFTEVAGWRVPSGHGARGPGLRAAREGAAILDLSPIGRIKVTGKDRLNLLQRISANDLRPLQSGRFAPTLFLTPKGRIVDRAHVLDRGDSLLLLTSPAGRARLSSWIRRYVIVEDFKMTDVTEETAAFALVGPASGEIVKRLAGVGVGSLEGGRFLGIPIENVETLIAPYDLLPSAWLLLAEMPGIVAVYDAALRAGEALGLSAIGSEDAEVLRIEAGVPADGHELSEDWNPWEARLEGSFSLSKGCYTGQEVVARLNTYDKVQRRIGGIRMGGVHPPATPQKIRAIAEDGSEHEAGDLTSTVFSDRLGEAIGLAYLRPAFEAAGTRVVIGGGGDGGDGGEGGDGGGGRISGTVASLPFV